MAEVVENQIGMQDSGKPSESGAQNESHGIMKVLREI